MRAWEGHRPYRTLRAPPLGADACSADHRDDVYVARRSGGREGSPQSSADLPNNVRGNAQILDQAAIGQITIVAGRTEHRRRMYRREDLALADWRRQLEHLAALLRHPKASSQQRSGRGRTKAHDQFRVDLGQFSFQPWPAGLDVRHLWCGVDAALAPLGETKVLHGVRDIDVADRNPGLGKRTLQQLAGWPDERDPLTVLGIAGLLADEHHRRSRVARGEDHLGRRLPEFTALARDRSRSQLLDVGVGGNPLGGAHADQYGSAAVADGAGPDRRIMTVLPTFGFDHVQHGVDQRQVSERLRKVAEMLSRVRVDLLGVQQQGTREGQQLAGALVLTDLAQGRDQPERADGEASFLTRESVVGLLNLVAKDELMDSEFVGDGKDRLANALVVGRQEPYQRRQQQ